MKAIIKIDLFNFIIDFEILFFFKQNYFYYFKFLNEFI